MGSRGTGWPGTSLPRTSTTLPSSIPLTRSPRTSLPRQNPLFPPHPCPDLRPSVSRVASRTRLRPGCRLQSSPVGPRPGPGHAYDGYAPVHGVDSYGGREPDRTPGVRRRARRCRGGRCQRRSCVSARVIAIGGSGSRKSTGPCSRWPDLPPEPCPPSEIPPTNPPSSAHH